MKSRLIYLLVLVLCCNTNLFSGGISVDAGITPPQDRFILRTQYRYMSMDNAMMSVNTNMMPLVLAYGVTSGFTVMARGMYVYQTFENTSNVNQGFNDLYLLTKFRLYRKNTAEYVFGIAPYLASNIPLGSKEISNRTWNPELGLNISYRPRFFSIDISASYMFSDISSKQVSATGNVFKFNTAFSALIPLKGLSSKAISPVIELTYINEENKDENKSTNLIFLSPGISFIHSSFTVEALVQQPIYQTELSTIMSQKTRLIVGVKYMF